MESKKLNTWLGLALFIIGIIAVTAFGFKFWTAYVVPGISQLETAGVTFWLFFAFFAGLASFFAPCSFTLFPAYIAYFLGTTEEQNHNVKVHPAKIGFMAALGVFVFFLILSGILLASGKAIVPYLFYVAPAVGIILIIAGILLVAGKTFKVGALQNILNKFKSKEQRSNRNIFLFGVGYGGASLGCTLPLLFALIVTPLSQGKLGLTFISFLVYAFAMSLLMIVVTYIVHKQRHTLIDKLSASTVTIKRVSGIILILVGVYLTYYNIVFSMLG
jgi:cytochrome c-type biogenesis protein